MQPDLFKLYARTLILEFSRSVFGVPEITPDVALMVKPVGNASNAS